MELAAKAVFGFNPEVVKRTKRPRAVVDGGVVDDGNKDRQTTKKRIPESPLSEDGVEETKSDNEDELDTQDMEDDLLLDSQPFFEAEAIEHPSRPPPSEQWIDVHRPVTVSQVVGNSKAKKELHRWIQTYQKSQQQQHTQQQPKGVKPCLLIGPIGIGKTCLASSLFKDHGYVVKYARDTGEKWLSKLENVLFQRSFASQPSAVIVDDVHTLDGHEKTKLVNMLKRKRLQVPIICIVDANVLPKHYSAIKTLSKVTAMYKPWNKPQDATILLKRLQQHVVTKLPLELASQCNGDLRALTIAAQLESQRPTTNTTNTTMDLFVAPFEGAKQLLSSHFPPQANQLMTDSMMPLFLQHNVPRTG
nr:AAA family ATPase [Gammaproteobacteria bacterium]